jgi:hypothetical protein
MATFYVKGKVDLTIIINTFGNASLLKMFVISVWFSSWFYLSLEVMFTITTMLPKIHYTKSLFQILMGSIKTSGQV